MKTSEKTEGFLINKESVRFKKYFRFLFHYYFSS